MSLNDSTMSPNKQNQAASDLTTATTTTNVSPISPDSLSFTLITEKEEHTTSSSLKLNKKTTGAASSNEQQQAKSSANQALTQALAEQDRSLAAALNGADSTVATVKSNENGGAAGVAEGRNNNEAVDEDEDEEEEEELPPISAASMLTRKDIKEFKESVRRDNDAIIKVGSGETVTVRVPTHEDGRLIFWEFATDYYDIGFGLYFEWTISPSNNVTVHVSDSSEDEEADEDDPTNSAAKQDIEKGGDKPNDSNKPPCDEIIPIFRRDCHEEVYAGSHLYPGRGVYLLKFDNSYSLWRSKTLYYRVYYSK